MTRLEQRSRFACEAAVDGVCAGCAVHAHHRRRRGQGGSDHPQNLLHVCFECHDWIHAHPTQAVELGLLEHTSAANGPLSNGVTIIDRNE